MAEVAGLVPGTGNVSSKWAVMLGREGIRIEMLTAQEKSGGDKDG